VIAINKDVVRAVRGKSSDWCRHRHLCCFLPEAAVDVDYNWRHSIYNSCKWPCCRDSVL